MPDKKPAKKTSQAAKPASTKRATNRPATAKPRAKKSAPATDAVRHRFPPEVRRAKIVEAAKEVLLPNPNATLDDVAEAAGVTRQLVSLYFPGGGTGPLYGAMFDEYMGDLPAMLGEDMFYVGTNPAKVREATEQVVVAVLDAVEEMGQSWVFADPSLYPGSGIGARLERANEYTADLLMEVRGSRNPLVRAALIAELTGFNAICRRLLDGELSRTDAERVLAEGFVAVYTVVIPALEA